MNDDGAPLEVVDASEAWSVEIIEPIPPKEQSPLRFKGAIEYDAPAFASRVGVVAPFDFGLDWEYWRYLPEGLSLYFTRTPLVSKPVGLSLARAVGQPRTVLRATRALVTLDPGAVLYACSSGSFVGGSTGDEAIRSAILAAGARQAITTSSAMIDALRSAGVERVGVATPYNGPLTRSLVGFLEEAGFTVPVARYLGLSSGIQGVSRRTIADLVRETSHPRVEAVFVSCTALRTFGIVAGLEEEIGVPVFTANQVSLWAAIRATRPEALDPEHPGWVLGGGQPMARSTEMLIAATLAEAGEVSA